MKWKRLLKWGLIDFPIDIVNYRSWTQWSLWVPSSLGQSMILHEKIPSSLHQATKRNSYQHQQFLLYRTEFSWSHTGWRIKPITWNKNCAVWASKPRMWIWLPPFSWVFPHFLVLMMHSSGKKNPQQSNMARSMCKNKRGVISLKGMYVLRIKVPNFTYSDLKLLAKKEVSLVLQGFAFHLKEYLGQWATTGTRRHVAQSWWSTLALFLR